MDLAGARSQGRAKLALRYQPDRPNRRRDLARRPSATQNRIGTTTSGGASAFEGSPDAWVATFADPDGNYFQLVSPWQP